MTEPRSPCQACPWRVEAHADEIPFFSLDLAESLSATSPDERGSGPDALAPQFACHQSRPGEEIVCAGWRAAVGHAHPMVRLAVIRGDVTATALTRGADWPVLHESFAEVIEKLRADCENQKAQC
jgi:hypothetical protein